MNRRMAVSLIVLATAGPITACQVANPTVSGLETAKQQAAAGNHAAVARLDANCQPSEAGCAQLRRVKADSCGRLADAAGADGSARRSALDCAVTNYDAALAAAMAVPDSNAPPGVIAVELLDAQARRRDAAKDRADALQQDAALLSRSQTATRMSGEAHQAGLIYGADAELNRVLLGSSGGCDGIGRADALLAQSQPSGNLAARRQTLGRAVANARQSRGCAA
jgi:hypothetical protein